MICKKCGHESENTNALFCSNCGASLESIDASPAESFVEKKKILNSRKKMFIVLAIIVSIIIFAGIRSLIKSDEERIIGTWGELSYTGNNRTYTYEEGEGDKVTFGKDGKIIDGDSLLGAEFSYHSYVDVLSWAMVDNTLIFYLEYGDVAYVPYKLSGKKLTLYFSDERMSELQRIK